MTGFLRRTAVFVAGFLAAARIGTSARPVHEAFTFATCSGVPSATSWPPPEPPSGPRSITQSARFTTSRLCSTTSTVLPASTSRSSTASSCRTSAMCSPVVGSSRM